MSLLIFPHRHWWCIVATWGSHPLIPITLSSDASVCWTERSNPGSSSTAFRAEWMGDLGIPGVTRCLAKKKASSFNMQIISITNTFFPWFRLYSLALSRKLLWKQARGRLPRIYTNSGREGAQAGHGQWKVAPRNQGPQQVEIGGNLVANNDRSLSNAIVSARSGRLLRPIFTRLAISRAWLTFIED